MSHGFIYFQAQALQDISTIDRANTVWHDNIAGQKCPRKNAFYIKIKI